MAAALLFMPFKLQAANDTRTPGIYAVVGDTAVPLQYQKSNIVSLGVSYFYATRVYYKGAHSNFITDTYTFLLVTDTIKSSFSTKKPFVRGITPNQMRFIPLVCDEKENRRTYDAGIKIADGWIYEDDLGVKFDWEQVADNAYLITLPHPLYPGEYGFSFSKYNIRAYDFLQHIYGFTVPQL